MENITENKLILNNDTNTSKNNNPHLRNPIILDRFNKHYIQSLKVFIDDKAFKSKVESLPSIKCSVISKFEKMIEKEKNIKKFKNKLKSGNLHEKNNSDSDSNKKGI